MAATEGEGGNFPALAHLIPLRDGHVGDGAGGRPPAVERGREDLPGPHGERVEVDGPAEQVRPVDGDLPDPAEGHEDRPPPQRDDQPEGARRLTAGDRPDDHVPNPPDGAALAVEQRSAVQPGREDPLLGSVGRCLFR
jgi:hypothetical protein